MDPADVKTKEGQDDAQGLLFLAPKNEYVEVKSYVDKRMEEVLTCDGAPLDPSIKRSVREAEMQRKHYYFWMRDFLMEKSLEYPFSDIGWKVRCSFQYFLLILWMLSTKGRQLSMQCLL